MEYKELKKAVELEVKLKRTILILGSTIAQLGDVMDAAKKEAGLKR